MQPFLGMLNGPEKTPPPVSKQYQIAQLAQGAQYGIEKFIVS
jgi:hypothetical protein